MKKVIFLIILIVVAAITTFVYHKTQGADINYYRVGIFCKLGRCAERE
ncbi:MAG: hypothetical protein JW946_01235 [Candidatus Omnitrophica bacterium]|nr:hypothetical protein [Candidatus Omnitrophota bacterium]